MKTNYVIAKIYFKDCDIEDIYSPIEYENVIIKLNEKVEKRSKDEKIFFYCNGEEELQRLMQKNNGEDFVVVDWEYTEI